MGSGRILVVDSNSHFSLSWWSASDSSVLERTRVVEEVDEVEDGSGGCQKVKGRNPWRAAATTNEPRPARTGNSPESR